MVSVKTRCVPFLATTTNQKSENALRHYGELTMKQQKSISLPDFPKAKEFEEYISAFFQSNGNYIERNIIERDVDEVLELDIISTNYDDAIPQMKLIEVKSGNWGFPDIFKVKGWMQYLQIPEGAFYATKAKEHQEFCKSKADKMNISVEVIQDLKDMKEVATKCRCDRNIDDHDIITWRFSYWIERNLLKRLTHKKKSHQDKKCFQALSDYYFELNSEIFFTENIGKRVEKLYATFQKFPRISAKCGHELIGENFDDNHAVLPQRIFEQTYYDCKYTDIQISTYIEHRARLTILKNAIDYLLYKRIGDAKKTEDLPWISEWGISTFDMLPASFKDALIEINEHEYLHRYPAFWQWFLWVLGGFILNDYKEEEFEILSEKTGIPVEEIPNAFSAYDILFPNGDGWLKDLAPHSNISIMKMFSAPFMGIGAYYRRLIHSDEQNLNDLKLTGVHTHNDLVHWNNLVVRVLSKE